MSIPTRTDVTYNLFYRDGQLRYLDEYGNLQLFDLPASSTRNLFQIFCNGTGTYKSVEKAFQDLESVVQNQQIVINQLHADLAKMQAFFKEQSPSFDEFLKRLPEKI